MSIFQFKTYKEYLNSICEAERGNLSRLAEAGGCQKSYLSACLKSKGQLSLDHAFGMAEHLGLTDAEQDYFFLLIEKEKAVTSKLRHRLETKAKDLARESLRLKNQQKGSVVISEGNPELGLYYRTWLPTAIHMLTSVPRYQSTAALAKRLNIPPEGAVSFLGYLEKMDLVMKAGEKYKWNSANIHLADNSLWIQGHHANWRLRAIDNIQKDDREASHYSAVQSFSEEDFDKLKRLIANFIREFNGTSDPSEPEEVFCLNIDLFRV
jgi:uncharacterized protein (TIGR02147 family)